MWTTSLSALPWALMVARVVLAAPANSSLVSSEVIANNETSLSAPYPQSWGPFTQQGYVLEGTYDRGKKFTHGAEDIPNELRESSDNFFAHKRGSTRAPRGRQEIIYGTHEEVKITLQWVMEGDTETYDASHHLIKVLCDLLEHKPQIRTHPLEAFISDNGQRKIRVLIELDPGQIVHIDSVGSLQFTGSIWPDRRLPIAQVRSTLERMREASSCYPSQAQIPPDFSLVIDGPPGSHFGISVQFDHDEHDLPPAVTFGNLNIILHGILLFFWRLGKGAVLSGGLYNGPEQVASFGIWKDELHASAGVPGYNNSTVSRGSCLDNNGTDTNLVVEKGAVHQTLPTVNDGNVTTS